MNPYTVLPQENASLRCVAKMYYGKKYNKGTWAKIDNDVREVINMLCSMGFLEWKKVKGGSMLVECHNVNLVFPTN